MKRPSISSLWSFCLALSLAGSLACGPLEEDGPQVATTTQALIKLPTRNNLVAVTASGKVAAKPGLYCNMSEGNLIIRVKNDGSLVIGATVAAVEGPFGSVAFSVPSLPPRYVFDYALDPLQVGSPFKIAVDATQIVAEYDENNTFGGTCP